MLSFDHIWILLFKMVLEAESTIIRKYPHDHARIIDVTDWVWNKANEKQISYANKFIG
jgi:hypothetical protein